MSDFNYLNGTLRLCGTEVTCADLVSGIGILGFPGLTGAVSLIGSGDIFLSYSGNSIVIGGNSGSMPTMTVSTTGILSGFSTIVFNHNLNSTELIPELYVRRIGTNNWMSPDCDYNDSFFQKDLNTYGTYNVKTSGPIDGWSGTNMGAVDFFGFSGGKILCIPNSNTNDFSNLNNTNTSPLLTKPFVGDFDMWCQLTGDYLPGFIVNGLVAFSLNETGSVKKSFISIDNGTGGCRYKYRNSDGENTTQTPRPRAPFLRIKRNDNIGHVYIKSGVNQSWIPLAIALSPTGRAAFMDAISDEVHLGVHFSTTTAVPSGRPYTWDFFKTWSPIELQASGTNNILIINNVGITHEIKVVV